MKFILALFLTLAPSAYSLTNLQVALEMYERLTGAQTRVNDPVIQKMKTFLDQGDKTSAAIEATKVNSFYNITLLEWSKRFFDPENAGSIEGELTDASATLIGMIRDDEPFNKIFSADLLYKVEGMPAIAVNNNTHYTRAETSNTDLATKLVPDTISSTYGIDPAATAGIFTTRGFAQNFLEAGTNRAAIKFINNHLFCSEMEKTGDSTSPSQRIGRDVFANPNPSQPNLHKTYCMFCHGRMDAMRGAFANYSFDDNQLKYTANSVHEKYNINPNNNPNGFETKNNSWINYYAQGATATFGFSGNLSGNGLKSLGKSLTNSKIFSECMSQKVFEKICLHKPASASEREIVSKLGVLFSNSNYNMKKLFQNMAATVTCYEE